MSWLGRELDRAGGDDARQASAALIALATDPEEMLPIRQSGGVGAGAVGARRPSALTGMANGNDTWLRQTAIQALANSGDPRAREFLRTAFQDPALPGGPPRPVIRGLGREYATGRDVELLRSRYATLSPVSAKQAVLSVLAEQGGAANLQWLLGVAARRHRHAGDPRAGDRSGADAPAHPPRSSAGSTIRRPTAGPKRRRSTASSSGRPGFGGPAAGDREERNRSAGAEVADLETGPARGSEGEGVFEGAGRAVIRG